MKNGGKGPNRIVERIILESPLVQIYRNIQKTIQANFDHTHLTSNHAAPDMAKTFLKLQERLHSSSPHAIRMGRKTQHVVAVLSDKGITMMEKVIRGEANEKDTSEENRVELEDVLVEMLE